MNELRIMQLANGFLVILPVVPVNVFDPQNYALGIAKGMHQNPNEIEKEIERKKNELPKDENSFIFKEFEEVLAFLADRFLTNKN